MNTQIDKNQLAVRELNEPILSIIVQIIYYSRQ